MPTINGSIIGLEPPVGAIIVCDKCGDGPISQITLSDGEGSAIIHPCHCTMNPDEVRAMIKAQS